MPESRMVDSLAILGAFLRSNAAVTARVGQRSSITLQNDDPSIRYALVAGSSYLGGVGFPRFQVECWGSDPEQVNTVALDVAQALTDLPGTYEQGVVAGVVVTPPFVSDDPLTHRCRQIVGVEMLTQPGGTT